MPHSSLRQRMPTIRFAVIYCRAKQIPMSDLAKAIRRTNIIHALKRNKDNNPIRRAVRKVVVRKAIDAGLIS